MTENPRLIRRQLLAKARFNARDGKGFERLAAHVLNERRGGKALPAPSIYDAVAIIEERPGRQLVKNTAGTKTWDAIAKSAFATRRAAAGDK